MQIHRRVVLFGAVAALCGACSADGTSGTGEPDGTTGASGGASGASDGPMEDAGTDTGEIVCEEDPNLTLQGDAVPLSGFEFLNAFDPSDRAVYDPDDVDALPGPLMVDTWGDRATGPHGTLAVFPPGFAAPLHTHSNAYYGVVLRGEMTNPFGTALDVFLDDDDTNNNGDAMLGPGSFWHVPAGSQHTTTCVGPEVCWFYFHAEEFFDFAPFVDEMGALLRGVELEEPHPDAVELPNSNLSFMGDPGSFVQFASAWGNMGQGPHGTFALFTAGAASPVHVHSAEYYGVVVSGGIVNPFNLATDSPVLETGGYWSVPAESVHVTACEDGLDCLFYFHSRAGFDFIPLCEQPES